MRLKKQKRHRKVVRFYTACFGFREPFKVLCDGTFVHHLHVNSITPANTALSNILGATVKIFTTRCVLAELKSLGESYSESLKAARNLFTARCDHEKRKSAVACIVEIIGEDNPEHFFVATQDADLRKNLQEVLQEYFADRQCNVPTGTIFSADRFNFVPMAIPHCRWQFQSAGGDPLCPRDQS